MKKKLVIVEGNSPELIKVNIENRPIIGSLKVTKIDSHSGEKLSNSKFQIKNEKGEIIKEGTTDENGIAIFDDLIYGKYKYVEIEAPEGYDLDTTEYPFEIKEDGEIVEIEIDNKERLRN